MKPYRKVPYDDERDFLRVRNLLIETYQRDGVAHNWMIDRWEFCRTFAQTLQGTTEAWPSTVGLWVDASEQIRAVATSEGEGHGEAHFFLGLPEGPVPCDLVQQLFDHAQQQLAVRTEGGPSLQLRLRPGHPELEAEATRRGLRPVWTETMSHKRIDPDERLILPEGFRLAWGFQVSDEAKGQAHVRAFDYAIDPRAPLAPACWKAQRTMPDWRDELELFALDAEGEVAAFVNLWWDEVNRLAVCEPVGTVPRHQRKGLARGLIAEGGRRAAALGARELLVGTDQPFYRACGFVPREQIAVWEG